MAETSCRGVMAGTLLSRQGGNSHPGQLPTRPKLRLDFLGEAEMLSLLDELPARLHAFIKFLFYQGLRSREAEAITWAQLDLNKAIFFPDAERNTTGDSRVKALADHTVEAL